MQGEMSADAVRRLAGFTEAEAQAVVDRCTATTTAHRRWSRWWCGYAVATFTAGAVLDTVGYVRHGYPATLTCFLRRSFGLEPRTRWARAGQLALGGFLGWCLLHLTFGVLGPSRGRELV